MAQHNIVDLTYSQLQSLIGSNGIVRGILYNITNAQASHNKSVPTKVIVQGITPNMVTEDGVRFQLIPDYNALPIWNEGLTSYNIGDKCIYGSRVWVNVSGSLGSPNGYFPANLLSLSNDWVQVPYEEGDDYTLTQIECKYNVVNDLVIEQKLGGLTVSAPGVYALALGFSPLDYCDWGLTKKIIIQDVLCLIFLNNYALTQALGVFSSMIANNGCKNISDVKTIIDKSTTQGIGPLTGIAFNKCKIIRSISNTQGINNIPDTVNEYSFVTDDESGYLEHDFSNAPLASGDTLVLGCILNKGVAFTGVQMASDGNLPTGVNITIGIDTDAPTYATKLSNNINTEVQYINTPSARTTDFNRLIVLTADGALNSGVLRVAYKYL